MVEISVKCPKSQWRVVSDKLSSYIQGAEGFYDSDSELPGQVGVVHGTMSLAGGETEREANYRLKEKIGGLPTQSRWFCMDSIPYEDEGDIFDDS